MDWRLKTGAFKTKLNNENEISTNSNTQQFVKEAETTGPSPSNVSSSRGTYTKTGCIQNVYEQPLQFAQTCICSLLNSLIPVLDNALQTVDIIGV
jgi:hypothetical protein